MMKKKIILFGGSFDPIHNGHIKVALHAVEYVGAAEVVFVPAGLSPHKPRLPFASDSERLEMIALAISGEERFRLSDCELKRAGPSYTLDTVRQFSKDYGSGVELFWLAGADCVEELPQWHGILELIDECNLCVMYRAGFTEPSFEGFRELFGVERVGKLAENVIPTPLIDISSTEIRAGLAEGRDLAVQLPAAVAEYISSNKLYQGGGKL